MIASLTLHCETKKHLESNKYDAASSLFVWSFQQICACKVLQDRQN